MNLALLDSLEAKIQEAADRLAALAEANQTLERRISELEAELALAASTGRAPEAWESERAEAQRRVERLVARLEELLGG